jgi:hypothetical protein
VLELSLSQISAKSDVWVSSRHDKLAI